jgi:hypothetical protein
MLCEAISRAEGEAPDLIRGASVKPKVVDVKPKKVPRSRRVTVDEDEPDLIGAK